MSWGAVVGAGVGLVGSIYSSKKSKKAADKAGEREAAASAEALERQEAAYEEAKMALSPYARQEAAASSQMMRQLGLAPAAGAGGGGADPWGFADQPFEGGMTGGRNLEQFDRVIEDMMAQQQVIAKRAGYNKSKVWREAANRMVSIMDTMKRQGKIPPGYQMPTHSELTSMARDIEDRYGGHKNMARSLYRGISHPTYDPMAAVDTLLERFDIEFPTEQPPAAAGEQMGAPAGEPAAGPGSGPGGAFTAGDIMGMAGVEQLPQEIQDQYLTDLMEDPRTDPELAAYLGLTPESLEPGDAYRQTAAYEAAREAGVEAVDAAAAAGSGLYSGRRGRALRDVGQEVEQQYYFDAKRTQEQMMAARRGERAAAIGRRGVEYGAERAREQSYYNNYMQMLNAMASPTTTTNIAAMGTSLGKEAAANITGTARSLGDLDIGAAGASQAAIADVTGGIMDLAGTWIENRPTRQQAGTGG